MKIFTPTKFRRGVDYILLDKYDRLASAVGGGDQLESCGSARELNVVRQRRVSDNESKVVASSPREGCGRGESGFTCGQTNGHSSQAMQSTAGRHLIPR